MELIVLMCSLLNANDCREHRETIPPEIHAEMPHECTRFMGDVMPRVMEMLPKRRVSRWSCKPVPAVDEREA
jgi:hypothetical protein